MITFNNVQVSNTVLTDREIRHNASQSMVTEVLMRIDELPGYIEGETQVEFVGTVNGHLLAPASIDSTRALLAQRKSGESLGGYTYLNIMINDLMLRKTSIMPEGEAPKLNDLPEISSMPAWPSEGSIKMVDGTAVVKLS